MSATANPQLTLNCLLSQVEGDERVQLAHGEGGRLMRRLIQQEIVPSLDNELLRMAGDATLLPACAGQLALTTDSYVVSPLFFPGGDIGSLAVYGTVNDLAVSGARPRWISLALILEEGLELAVLRRVLSSVARAARRAGVVVVTGDTKVVTRGAADQLFINTAGVGEVLATPPSGPRSLAVGDALIVSGPIGRHGIAVMVAREGLELFPLPESDSAPLADAVVALQTAGVSPRALRDATRGGLGAVLHEWAQESGLTLAIEESKLPITAEVRGACELLGLDPFHVANEGTMVLAVPNGEVEQTLKILHQIPETAGATLIGHVEARRLAPVIVLRVAGQFIPLDEPIGAALPRIC